MESHSRLRGRDSSHSCPVLSLGPRFSQGSHSFDWLPFCPHPLLFSKVTLQIRVLHENPFTESAFWRRGRGAHLDSKSIPGLRSLGQCWCSASSLTLTSLTRAACHPINIELIVESFLAGLQHQTPLTFLVCTGKYTLLSTSQCQHTHLTKDYWLHAHSLALSGVKLGACCPCTSNAPPFLAFPPPLQPCVFSVRFQAL